MKKFLPIIFFFINLSFVQAIETKIIHNIQNEIITNIDIKNEFKYLLALNNDLEKLNKESIFKISSESIIKEKIKEIEISKFFKKIELDIKYLDALLESIYSRKGLKSLEEFEVYLKDYDITLGAIEKKITIDALWNELIVRKYAPLVEINEEKIKKKIKNNISNQTKEYQLSEIVYEVKNKEEIAKRYDEIAQNIIEKGFENTASMYSISKTSKIGGDLGWINEKSLNNLIKEKIEKLDIGEISKPIIIPNGILILRIKNSKNTKIETNFDLELKKAINFEKSRQLDQFSKIYFNKIKKNLEINE
jgi:peptidyl-prolyl cis-trans isomerase SurA